MGLHALGNASFFKRSLSCPELSGMEIHEELVQAARVLQEWWKQAYLRQTAKESSQYFQHVVSRQKADSKSFSDLEAFILDRNTLAITHKLLAHLEQAKDLIIPERGRCPDLPRPERVFLSAYLIATKSDHIFESPTEIDALLLTHADEMLKSFERLCKFMGETYMDKRPHKVDSPIARETPSSDQVFAAMEHYQLHQSRETIENDHTFMTEGRAYLEAFHYAQVAYYETFSKWEADNRFKLAKICIAQYLRIEAKRFAIFSSPDPRQLEMYEGFGSQQETLRGKVEELLGEEGILMLEHDLQGLRAALEANKWVTAPAEVLLHELALNPEFTLPPGACMIHPRNDIDAAITAVTAEPLNLEPMLEVLAEIREQIALFTPRNRIRIMQLREEFGRKALTDQIEAAGLERGLYQIMYALMERIKELESPEHVPETVAFQNQLDRRISSGESVDRLLKQTLDFYYHKFSQISLEITNFHINRARGLVAHNIVEFERRKFQERLAKNQFNLASVLAWVDSIVKTPTNHRLDTSILCSQYIATYTTHAICLGLLQKPGNFDLHAVPETFYLDRGRLVDWHGKYQRIFYTAAAMGIFCQQYGAGLSPQELQEQKQKIMTTLETANITDPKEAVSYIVSLFNTLLASKGKPLSESNERALTEIMENTFAGNHRIAEIMNKRLGDQLWIYFSKGFLPEASQRQAGLYGLQKELSQLGQEMLPLLRLHTKVHEEFYRHSVNERLWNPLFTVLREPREPNEFSSLLSPKRESIRGTHAYIHKMAFLLSGLALIQQTVVYADMWNMNAVMKNSTMKALASSFGLIEMVKDPRVSKDDMEVRLLALMKHVASEQEIPYEEADEQKMIRMLRLAKNNKSPGCRAFLDELAGMYRQFITRGKMPKYNPNLLTAEFAEEIDGMCGQVKEIITDIKRAQMPDDVDPVLPIIPTLRSGIGMRP
ncbi:T-complex protein 11 [Legionella oakridgensis ATCC 33761 = DSM 21215]|uniref:T-complex protein 11 n=3 Tax=Legionella oakridgensis TaxID=29423 RepID=W0BCA9_9GAMM|nr:T-complex protein 11 [Legionella oakridgensis ATCC 33761 = DSM 21215]ETO93944.1 T-complex protein 11 [Legionella oakridgensis RV-2-2007]KTD37248.1 T-complex protein 11 [Legionella oakridgensis]STY16200.1 T-complex protein 11 [Legionella longbeachae]